MSVRVLFFKETVPLMAVLIAACGSGDPATELADAQRSLEAREYRTAALHLSNVLQADPDNTEARVLRGRLALVQGDYGTAVVELRAAMDRGVPSEPDLALDLAEASLYAGDAPAAGDVLERVETAYAGDQAYWALRTEIEIARGSLESATTALSRASALGEPTASMLISEASLAVAGDDLPRAETTLDTAADRFPLSPRVHQARGLFFQRAGRLDEAAASFTRAAERFEADGAMVAKVPILLALVQIYLGKNETALAAAAASHLSAIAPQSALTLYAEGLVSYSEGRFDEAANLVERAAIAQPDVPAIITLHGAVHLARGNLGQAEQQLLHAVTLDSGNVTAIKLLAETRLRQQRPGAALEALRPLSALATDDGHIGLLTGIASTRSGDLEQGVRHLENALSAQPNDQRVRLELARAYLVAGRNSEASELLRDGFADGSEPALEAAVIRLFAEVGIGNAPKSDEAAAALVATFPDKARALTAVAAFELHRGRTEQADALLERAAASDAEYAPARLLRVERLIQQGRTDEAEAELNAAAARDPGVESQLALVRLYVRLGRLDEAGRLIASAEEEARGDPGVLATQGILALARGAAADAVRYLAAAQAARPDRIGIVVWLAQAQLASGATDQARATLVGALARVPSSPQLRSALAMLELSAGNAGAADGLAHALQTEFPRDAAGFLIAGEVAIASRFYDDAAENFEQAFAREPAWPVRQRWINALQLAGHGSEVLEQYVAAATEEPENVVALNNAAWLLQLQGRSDEALPIAQRANRVAPNNASVLDTLGWILLSKGRGQDAVSYLEKAVALEPNAVEIRYHLAVALAQSGDAAQARNLLEELLDDHRPFDQRAEAQALLERL